MSIYAHQTAEADRDVPRRELRRRPRRRSFRPAGGNPARNHTEHAEPVEKPEKTLVQTILPRIALYKAMQESLPETETHARMRRYMLERVAAQKHAEMMRMEAIPGFYALYSRIFL